MLSDTFQWLAQHRGRQGRAALWPSVHLELLMALLLVPRMESCLSQPWSARVEAADASPGGHGRAYAEFPPELVKDLARLSDHKGCYTNLSLPWGIECDGSEVCPLQRCHWPTEHFHWVKVGRPGGYRMIALEEMAAQAWSLEDRLRRPADFGCRCLQGCDSASGTGALLKGQIALEIDERVL